MNARSTRIGLRSASAFLLVAAATVGGSGTAQAATHVWGTAIEVPGMTGPTGLNPSLPWVTALSCSSAGNCEVGGSSDSGLTVPAWVAEEVNGTWQNAQPVPNVAALNAGDGTHGLAGLDSISCPAAGSCTAVGHYRDTPSSVQSWVADEVNGTWQNAQEIPGTATLNVGGFAIPSSLSCASAGNCSAGGTYSDSQLTGSAFVVNEVSGIWQNAQQVPGMAALGTGGDVNAVSCATAGNCSAVGSYADASNAQQAFAVNEIGGVWGTAHKIPGIGTLNKGGRAGANGVSCASAGNCGASGSYTDAASHQQPFVVNEVGGTWKAARQVPGMSTLNKGSGEAYPISCRSTGNCSTGGSYHDAAGHEQAFVANEVSGTWHSAHEVPGTATLNKGGDAWVGALSCNSAGNCSAGGGYTDQTGTYQAFVADETASTWRTAKEVPGTAALNTTGLGTGYGAYVDALSCVASGPCAAAGEYWDSSNNRHVFVVNRS